LFASLSITKRGIQYLESSNLIKDLESKIIQLDYPIDQKIHLLEYVGKIIQSEEGAIKISKQ